MYRYAKFTAGLIAAVSLAGCVQDTASSGASAPTTPTGAIMPTAAEQACLRDVTATTNNPDVVVLDSSFSEAGTQVIVGVGPDRARWNCIAYEDGTTEGIESMTDEGFL